MAVAAHQGVADGFGALRAIEFGSGRRLGIRHPTYIYLSAAACRVCGGWCANSELVDGCSERPREVCEDPRPFAFITVKSRGSPANDAVAPRYRDAGRQVNMTAAITNALLAHRSAAGGKILNPVQFWNGLRRRDFLHAGSLSFLGLGTSPTM